MRVVGCLLYYGRVIDYHTPRGKRIASRWRGTTQVAKASDRLLAMLAVP
jgi:hypothetical protein